MRTFIYKKTTSDLDSTSFFMAITDSFPRLQSYQRQFANFAAC